LIVRICAELLRPIDALERESIAGQTDREVTLNWFGTIVAVRFDDAAAAEIYRRRYQAFAGSGPPKRSARVYAEANGNYCFTTDLGRSYRWTHGPLTPRSIAFLADIVVRRIYFSEIATFASFHAATIAVDGVAAAIVASSRGGKTTTAIACARRKMPVYSDERCVVIDGFAQPFPRSLSIRREALHLLALDSVVDDGGIGSRLRARRFQPWTCAGFEEVFGTPSLPPAAPLAAIFFIDGYARTPSVRPLSNTSALPKLIAAPLRSQERGIDSVALGMSLLRQSTAFSLTLGSPDETALAIRAAVRTSTAQCQAC